MKFFWEDIKLSKGQLILFLLIFQSIGIRFFQGQGVVLPLTIILLNISKIRFLLNKGFISFFVLLITVCIFQEIDFKTIILYALIFISTGTVVVYYLGVKKSFLSDFKGVANFFCLYGTITFLLILLLPQAFTLVNYGLSYLSFAGIFINANSPLFSGWYRISSLGWEPGTFQLIAALYLLIVVNDYKQWKKIIWLVFILILTGSSMGYINLLVILLFFLLKNKNSIKIGVTVLIVGVFLFPIVQSNFFEKTSGSNAGSGVIRLRDLRVGLMKISENPIIGFPVSELYRDSKAKALEDKVWDASGIYSTVPTLGHFAGGYTNGLLGVFLNWGVPLGLFILFLFYKSPLIRVFSKEFTIFFMIVFLLSTISEPITFTPLFFIFPISFFYRRVFLLKRRREQTNNLKIIDSNKVQFIPNSIQN